MNQKKTKKIAKAKKVGDTGNLSLKGLGIVLGRPLRSEILSRAKLAFANADASSVDHVTRCHNVTKNSLAYRLPADKRTERGQAVIVTRIDNKVTITNDVISGINPILGWPD